jgi:hypothetical protein
MIKGDIADLKFIDRAIAERDKYEKALRKIGDLCEGRDGCPLLAFHVDDRACSDAECIQFAAKQALGENQAGERRCRSE